MPKSQAIGRIGSRRGAVHGDTVGIAEGHPPRAAPALRATDAGGRFLQKEPPQEGLPSSPGNLRGLNDKEAATSHPAVRRASRDAYLWHSGASVSSAVPPMVNHGRTSLSRQVPTGFAISRPRRPGFLLDALAVLPTLNVLRRGASAGAG